MKKADIVITNARIYDGCSNPPYKADMAICKDRIEEIGNCSAYEARERIDAKGLALAPGFVDTHVHSDLMLLYDRQHANGLCQGVTTEILGQDGLSYAPLSGDRLEDYVKYIAGLNGNPDIPHTWSSVWSYMSNFDGKAAVNTAYLIPHGALRLEIAGFKDCVLTKQMLEKAQRLLAQGIEEGAVGMSTGLSYFPGSYADTQELIELARVLAEYGVPYVTHLRSVFKKEWFDPTGEAIRIAEESGAPLHFSHYRTWPKNAGKVQELMKDIDDAEARGVDISLELYPYPTGAGYLVAALPGWAVEGGWEATLRRLADKGQRERILPYVEKSEVIREQRFTHLRYHTEYAGQTFEEVAQKRNQTVAEMVCELLWEEKLEIGICGDFQRVRAETVRQLELDMLSLLERPNYMIGSDGIPVGLHPHPRAFGTFPRLLRFCREYGFPLEKMINRITLVPCNRFGFTDRGVIQKGKFADLVLFDPETICDTATYECPRCAPTGVVLVVVNGKIAVRDGKVTGIFAGRWLRRERDAK